ncbi:MAG: TrkH family potassium uptake protein [Clostridia bacterium]|nr:TrkH family potassium uptake protein [Oscillospiraceae bacterium]MBQ8275769.1 TrkH family potassium uptake protein [Clostridia bacterium]
MNRRMVFYTVGRIALATALLLLLPALVSLIYREPCGWSFLVAAGLSLAVAAALTFLSRPKSQVIYAREGFAIVALGWLLTSLLGCLPFILSGEVPSFFDAFFETVSGLTTTGASILTNVEALSHGLLFWRSFTHWIGGMGVLIFIMAIIPNIADRSIHIVRAEMPGPVVGKLVPRVKDTAKILYIIYIAMTLLEIAFLLFGGMPLFESVVHAFGTAGTGGFGVKADSIAGYSPYLQWVITVFMLLFGVNFNLYYLILIRRTRTALRSGELWCYLGIVALSTGVIVCNILPQFGSAEDALRHSAFQVASILTTTGYATTDFNLWPDLSRAILFVLMFIGGCAGSTAGGLKQSRAIMLVKTVGREFKRMLHPRSVSSVRFEGKPVDEATLGSVSTYFAVYMICLFAVFLLISPEPFGFETNLSAAVACFNNVGPGFGLVGPVGSYSAYSGFSKLVLSLAMLLGRLEIFPLILALSPGSWIKK